MTIPSTRIRSLVHSPPRADGKHVLVYMTATRRLSHNYALQRGVELAREHGVPLVILEALRCGYKYASDRFHTFVLQGMAEKASELAEGPVLYHPWVEPERGAGKGLLAAWAAEAVAVVADDHPGFFYPRMLRAAAEQVSCAFEAIDSVGLMPLSASPKAYSRAHDFRRFFQKTAVPHLNAPPEARPLDGGGDNGGGAPFGSSHFSLLHSQPAAVHLSSITYAKHGYLGRGGGGDRGEATAEEATAAFLVLCGGGAMGGGGGGR